MSDQLFRVSDDGSWGDGGLVTDVLGRLLAQGEQYDEVITIGPLMMMKYVCALTRGFGQKTLASMRRHTGFSQMPGL